MTPIKQSVLGFTLILILPLWFATPSLATTDLQGIRREIAILKNLDISSGDRPYAINRLARIGKPAVPTLIQALVDEKFGVNGAVATILERIGPAAVPALIQALGDKDPKLRYAAADVLGRIGPAAKDAVSALSNAMGDENLGVRSKAAYALGRIGPAAKNTIPALINALGDEADGMRSAAADALSIIASEVGSEAKDAVPTLIKALRDKDHEVRFYAASALGSIGPAAEEAVPAIAAAFREANPDDHWAASKFLLRILRPEGKKLDRVTLQQKILQLENLRETFFKDLGDERDQLDLMLRALRAEYEKQPPFWAAWVEKHKLQEKWWAWAMAGYVVFLLVVLPIWLLLHWLNPLWLYRLNELIPPVGVKIKCLDRPVGLRQLLFLSPFHYCNRVLDAWVQAHLRQARIGFAAMDTVRDRAIYIPIPVTLNGHTVAQPSPEDFQEVFRKTPFCLLIFGEGGSGKTSIASHLAGLAMTKNPLPMLAKHRLLPVLIEHDFKIEDAPGQNPMLEAIRKQVVERMTEGQEIAPDLLRQLLRQQRLLVIVDHYSELSLETQEHIHPGYDPQLSLHAMIVTSRQEEKFQGSVTDTLMPLRIRGNRLSSFMEAYLTQRGKRELYDDKEFFAACGRLTEMVGDRNVTILLARMFADQMIATKEDPAFQDLPHNIPDLMLSYLNWINRNGKEENPTVQRITKAISWASLEPTFRPMDSSLAIIHQALAGEPELKQKLQYLCRDLGIIRCVGPAEDKVRVTLDPLSEYLAGLRMLELNGDKDESWEAFLEEADKKEGAPKSIEGFLLAVRDCCLAKGNDYGVPGFVERELAQKVGINLESKPANCDRDS